MHYDDQTNNHAFARICPKLQLLQLNAGHGDVSLLEESYEIQSTSFHQTASSFP